MTMTEDYAVVSVFGEGLFKKQKPVSASQDFLSGYCKRK